MLFFELVVGVEVLDLPVPVEQTHLSEGVKLYSALMQTVHIHVDLASPALAVRRFHDAGLSAWYLLLLPFASIGHLLLAKSLGVLALLLPWLVYADWVALTIAYLVIGFPRSSPKPN